jgi:hypothetical protein
LIEGFGYPAGDAGAALHLDREDRVLYVRGVSPAPARYGYALTSKDGGYAARGTLPVLSRRGRFQRWCMGLFSEASKTTPWKGGLSSHGFTVLFTTRPQQWARVRLRIP